MGRSLFGASLLALGIGPAMAACLIDTNGICPVVNSGTASTITVTLPTRLTNSGTIGSVIQTTRDYLMIDNQAGGTIGAIALAAGTTGTTNVLRPLGTTIVNAGTISGDVVFAPGIDPNIFVNAGGTVSGSIRQLLPTDFSSFIYIDRAGTVGATGTIDAGLGLDSYFVSRSSSGTINLTTALPSSFEVHGVEALGTGTVVTLTGGTSAAPIDGVGLAGTGAFVNTGVIGPVSTAASGEPGSAFPYKLPAVAYIGDVASLSGVVVTGNGSALIVGAGPALSGFTNSGTITGDLMLRTADFTNTNSGKIRLRIADAGTLIGTAADQDFSFVNAGTIQMIANGTGVRPIGTGAIDIGSAINIFGAIDTSSLHAASITNSGTITGGIGASLLANRFTFDNEGTISALGTADAVTLVIGKQISAPGALSTAVADSVAVTNGGTINSGVSIKSRTVAAAIANQGMIKVSVPTTDDPGHAALAFQNESLESSNVTFTNSGSIGTADTGGVGAGLISVAGDAAGVDLTLPPVAGAATARIIVANSGSIVASGGNLISQSGSVGIAPSVALGALAQAAGQTSIDITNSGTIDARTPTATAALPALGIPPITGGIALAAAADVVHIVNEGTIAGANGFSFPPTALTISIGTAAAAPALDFAGVVGGAIDTFGSDDIVTNGDQGVIIGGIALRGGNDRLENYGSITGNVFLGDGNDIFVQGINASLTGAVEGGADTDTLLIDITGGGMINQALFGQFVNFETAGITGTGTIATDGPLPVQSLSLAGGNLTIAAGTTLQTLGTTAIIGDPLLGGSLVNNGTIIGAVALGAGDDSVTNNGVIVGNVTLGDGNDLYAGSGTVTGNVDLGNGSDHFDASAIAGVSGIIHGGSDAGIDSVEYVLAGTSPTVTAATLTLASFDHLEGFEQVIVSGTGTILASGALPVRTIALAGTSLRVAAGTSLGTTGATTITGSALAENVVNDGTILGGISLGDGDDSLTTSGAVQGAIDLGAGSDQLVLTGPATFGSTVSGGAGSDTIVLATPGTDAAPTSLDLSQATGFETLLNNAGTNALSGTLAVNQIEVAAGRLIGKAGSVLNGTVTVASGATFGSAGTVNGNVNVAGTLSPGASPGTMTINGNVALAAGSTTLFEMTPAVSDALIINGGLAIASGSTLALTGSRPLTIAPYTLISASSGIAGSFTTVSQASTVFGFVRQTGSTIQLLGAITPPIGASPSVAATTGYLNGLLASGGVPIALSNVLQTLLTPVGDGNSVALGRLHPEPYASASQIGIENGLALVSTLRSAAIAPRRADGGSGLFTFGQAFGSQRELPGTATLATGRANVHSIGTLGGIGFGSGKASAAAFVGYVDARQNIRATASSTKDDGVVAGVVAQAKIAGVDIRALAAWDGGKAVTHRTLANGTQATGRYRMRGWTIDAVAGYGFEFQHGWSLRPELGVTYISSNRGGATESGAGAFGLNLASRRTDAGFASGGIRFETDPGAPIRPWVSVGARYQFKGRSSIATASLTGTTASFAVPGVTRDSTTIIMAGGISASLGNSIDLFARIDGEFASGNTSENGNAGILYTF